MKTSTNKFDQKLNKFLLNEILTDFSEKNINNFNDWLKYYSIENDFNEVVELVESFNCKVLRGDVGSISVEEKILMNNALALYSKEMDIDIPSGDIVNTIIITFIEIIRHYRLCLKGYLSMEGEVLISDRNKCKFYSIWSFENFETKLPVKLFK